MFSVAALAHTVFGLQLSVGEEGQEGEKEEEEEEGAPPEGHSCESSQKCGNLPTFDLGTGQTVVLSLPGSE